MSEKSEIWNAGDWFEWICSTTCEQKNTLYRQIIKVDSIKGNFLVAITKSVDIYKERYVSFQTHEVVHYYNLDHVVKITEEEVEEHIAIASIAGYVLYGLDRITICTKQTDT